MALGFSGSNGGIKIALGISGLNGGISKSVNRKLSLTKPLEVSYFVNNICNLSCRHCYVGYDNKNDSLSIEDWKKTFESLIENGALTFGNVGKEPLLSWGKTKSLLEFLDGKKKSIPKLRFGLVTNGTLFTPKISYELASVNPDYIDISLDGCKKSHDFIRGGGSFDKTIASLSFFKENLPSLLPKIFISYTLMKHNKDYLIPLADKLIHNYGIRNFVVSPYVPTTKDPKNELGLTDDKVVEEFSKLIDPIYSERKIGSNKRFGTLIYLKTDPDANKTLIPKLVSQKIINIENLLVDDYGTVFNGYTPRGVNVIVNYLESNKDAIRISHDGYISGCIDMFYEDYPQRALGNVKEIPVLKILNK